jgi:hypothetical protein
LVKRFGQLHRLLAILVILGLVIAPLSARANAAGRMAMAPVSDHSAMPDHAAMTAGMLCCPDQSAPSDCDQCPLMALCVTTTLQAPLPTGVTEIQPVALRMLLPVSDPEAESLALLPPPKPPRSLARPA